MTHRYDKRRKPSDEIKSWRIQDVSQVQDIHHQIKRRIFLGQEGKYIAKALGVSTVMVSSVKNSIPIKAELKLMHGNADGEVMSLAEKIDNIAERAVENLEEIVDKHSLDGEKVSVNLIAAESNKILDRSIGKPAQTVVTKSTHTFLTGDDIAKLKERAIAMGISAGMVNVTPPAKTLEAT